MSRRTIWTVPGKGEPLGYLRHLFSDCKAVDRTDSRKTSLAIVAGGDPDEQDVLRYLEVERRAITGEEL